MTEQHATLEDARSAVAAGELRNRIKRDHNTAILAAFSAMTERDRLKALNAELLAALEACNQELADAYHTVDFEDIPEHPARRVFDQARAAIARAKEK